MFKNTLQRLPTVILLVEIVVQYLHIQTRAEAAGSLSIAPMVHSSYPPIMKPVSYTHLDVYKRQVIYCVKNV